MRANVLLKEQPLFCCGHLCALLILAIAGSLGKAATANEDSALGDPVRVVIWDERQPEQKKTYGGRFLGEAVARHLQATGNFDVRLQALDDASQGLDETVLDFAEVIIWWGHVRHSKITPETGRKIVARISAGQVSLIALHSSHWATPFVEAMNEKSRQNALARYHGANQRPTLKEIPLRTRYYLPKRNEPRTPRTVPRKFPDGRIEVALYLPNCCFPAYRDEGKPSQLRVLTVDHPIAEGIPAQSEIAQTEMYDEPFQVPTPDEVLFEERWEDGAWFRSGMLWHLGKGKVFYFRPGHETYPIYHQKIPLKILTNATRWLADEQRKASADLATPK